MDKFEALEIARSVFRPDLSLTISRTKAVELCADALLSHVLAEREACAQVCDGIKYVGYVAPEDGAAVFFYNEASSDCADAIRGAS